MDSLSRFFNWTPGYARAGFCGAIQPAGSPDLREQTRREYAALLANLAASQLDVSESNGHAIYVHENLTFYCPGAGVTSLAEMLAKPAPPGLPRLYDAAYLNLNPAHAQALVGVDWGGSFFNGGAGAAYDFFGSSLDPAVSPDSFSTVRITFSHSATQKCYRYLRYELADGSAPAVGRVLSVRRLPRTCNFEVRDTVTGEQLDAAFVERLVTDDDGNPLPAGSRWRASIRPGARPRTRPGDREYLFVSRRPYSDTPKAAFMVDGGPLLELPWLYGLWVRLGSEGDVIDDGDAFRFSWGIPRDETFETRLLQMESQSLGDPAVAAAYGALASCLAGLNAGVGVGTVCDYTTPVRLSLAGADALPDRVELSWFAGATDLQATVERNDGAAWSAVGLVSSDGTGMLRFVDREVTAGQRYGYRLRTSGLATPLGEVWVEVPRELQLVLAGLRPNPATDGVTVHFTLPRQAPARLELIDVSGRRVLSREVGGLGAGNHALRLDSEAKIPAGLYFVRLKQGSMEVTARGVVVR